MPKTPTTTPADEAREALKRRRERREQGLVLSPPPVEALAIAGRLRERDHRDGCPVIGNPMQAGRVEAYDQEVIAPGAEARNLGLRAGDRAVIVRCMECGNLRYFAGYTDADAFVDEALELLTGDQAPADPATLDTTLT